MGPLGAGASVTSGAMVCVTSTGTIKYVPTSGSPVTLPSSPAATTPLWTFVALDLNANVYALDAKGNLFYAPHSTSTAVWVQKATQYTYPSGATVVPNGLTVSLEGSVLVSIKVTSGSPSTVVNYLFGLSMDGKTYYTNSGPSSTTSGTPA